MRLQTSIVGSFRACIALFIITAPSLFAIKEKDLIGQWRMLESNGEFIEFFEDNTFSSTEYNGKYKLLSDGRLKLDGMALGTLVIDVYENLKLDDGILTMLSKESKRHIWLKDSDFTKNFDFAEHKHFKLFKGNWKAKAISQDDGSSYVNIITGTIAKDKFERSIANFVYEFPEDKDRKIESNLECFYPTIKEDVFIIASFLICVNKDYNSIIYFKMALEEMTSVKTRILFDESAEKFIMFNTKYHVKETEEVSGISETEDESGKIIERSEFTMKRVKKEK
jgi:hypothetical protein